ncbi:hypothetical protein KJ596_00085 [Patescibacteria group bacterium]|nr:hypothetical protein [Patescibacteria group bacterium]MBU1867850.1 hypothetical protein [Patescibacteria group bacterium]
MAKSKIPSHLQSALWSYRLDKLNTDDPKDKNLVITSVLNHGTDSQVEWILKNYTPKEIKNVLRNPRPGTWWPESLNYWLQIYRVKVNSDVYARALQNIHPQT